MKIIIKQIALFNIIFLFSCGDSNNEPQKISEIRIGNQVWMTENLNVDKFNNGDPIPFALTSGEWKVARDKKQPAWCYLNNDPANGIKYGRLYNWYAVNDPRGIAPEGYHVPENSEWAVLIDYLGGENFAGIKMKSKTDWIDDGQGTNESGFNALPGGFRYADGENVNFYGLGVDAYYWSSTVASDWSASGVALTKNSNSAFIQGGGKETGMSVRCLKN